MGPRDPDGYAYLYPSIGSGRIIRFNGGEEVNGSRPECSLPYWLGNDEQSDQMESLRAENAALRERVAVLEKSIRWALGEVDMDGWFPLQGSNDPRYWWRSGLRSRAALAAAKPAENGAGGA